jgi:hypothetical protein
MPGLLQRGLATGPLHGQAIPVAAEAVVLYSPLPALTPGRGSILLFPLSAPFVPGRSPLRHSTCLVNPRPSRFPDVVVGDADDAQPPLPLASEGVLRWVWRSRFGAILIEVVGDEVFVNGQRVEPHAA